MARPRKITLAEAVESRAAGLTFACIADAAGSGGCANQGAMSLAEALER